MNLTFWDSSALVPLFLQESNSQQVRALVRQSLPVIWWGTPVELNSAISRSHRFGDLDDKSLQNALHLLSWTSRRWREVMPSNALREQAQALLNAHNLRAADSLQLAAALTWYRQKPARQPFVCADVRLCEAAEEVGLAVIRL